MNPTGRKSTVLVTGATGQVGVFALPRLLAAGHTVIALSRRISRRIQEAGRQKTPGLHWLHPDTVYGPGGPDRETGVSLQDIDTLLSCGPVELAARLTPHCPRLERVVCISTSSIYTKLESPDAAERRLIATIKAAEDELQRGCQARNIALALLRPTLIYGCGLDQNISRIARMARRFHFRPLAGKASGLRQPVHADDLAKLAVDLLGSPETVALVSPVGGGSILSYREMVERIFTGIGLPARIMPVPEGALVTLVRAVSWLPLNLGLNAGFVLRQNLDQVFDDRALRERLDFLPRPFQPGPGDFEIPESAGVLQPS